jgi:site-specific recombinase XerD
MDKAHIPRLKKRRGMHSLRHTMASVLLEKETPLPIISDIIGHLDINSTAIYRYRLTCNASHNVRSISRR